MCIKLMGLIKSLFMFITYIFIVNVLSAVIPIYPDGSFLMSPEYISLNLAKGHFYISDHDNE